MSMSLLFIFTDALQLYFCLSNFNPVDIVIKLFLMISSMIV